MSKQKLTINEEFMDHLRLGNLVSAKKLAKEHHIDLNQPLEYRWQVERSAAGTITGAEFPLSHVLSWMVSAKAAGPEIVSYLLANGAKIDNHSVEEGDKNNLSIALEKYCEMYNYGSFDESDSYLKIIEILVAYNVGSVLTNQERDVLLDMSARHQPIYNILSKHFNRLDKDDDVIEDKGSTRIAGEAASESAVSISTEFWTRRVSGDLADTHSSSFSGFSGRLMNESKLLKPLSNSI